MTKTAKIVKSTGELELFDGQKLLTSLINSGASECTANQILTTIKPMIIDGVKSRDIYNYAFNILKKSKNATAAKYSLKNAIMELGPTGHPFEQFIGQLLKHQGFEVKVAQLVQGQCIQHEVDVIATSSNKQYLVECKFYNTAGKFANVHVPLYIHSRVNDIIKKRSGLPEFKDLNFYGWIVTNTRFTTDAADYGRCAGLQLMSWDYPNGHSLKDMVEKNSFYPITALTTLEKYHKKFLISQNIVICKQLINNESILESAGIKGIKIQKILNEVDNICSV